LADEDTVPSPGGPDGDPADGEESPGPAFRLVLQLRSTADPSLIVDAAALWNQPETVLARFGPQTETDLLLALRRGASVWPTLAQVLEQASPSAAGRRRDRGPSRGEAPADQTAGPLGSPRPGAA
jgi:hypothetical protein